jgi:hypothetical protein
VNDSGLRSRRKRPQRARGVPDGDRTLVHILEVPYRIASLDRPKRRGQSVVEASRTVAVEIARTGDAVVGTAICDLSFEQAEPSSVRRRGIRRRRLDVPAGLATEHGVAGDVDHPDASVSAGAGDITDPSLIRLGMVGVELDGCREHHDLGICFVENRSELVFRKTVSNVGEAGSGHRPKRTGDGTPAGERP